MDENVRKPLTFLASVAIILALSLGLDRVKAYDTFQSYFANGKDLGHLDVQADKESLVYRAEPGDTWDSVAREHAVSTRALLEVNGADPTSSLRPGQRIKLPGATPVGSAQPTVKSPTL